MTSPDAPRPTTEQSREILARAARSPPGSPTWPRPRPGSASTCAQRSGPARRTRYWASSRRSVSSGCARSAANGCAWAGWSTAA
ncbi:hypothetical protein NKG05_27025 [Oerskovia sp. M15]